MTVDTRPEKVGTAAKLKQMKEIERRNDLRIESWRKAHEKED